MLTAPLTSSPTVKISPKINRDDRLPPHHQGRYLLPDDSVKVNFANTPVYRRRTHSISDWRNGVCTTEVATKITRNYYVFSNVVALPIDNQSLHPDFRKITHLDNLTVMGEEAKQAIKAFLKNEAPAQKVRSLPVLQTLATKSRFFEQLEELCAKMIATQKTHQWLNKETLQQFNAWFCSNIIGGNTALSTVEACISKFDISLDCNRFHPSGQLEEIVIDLVESQKGSLEETVFLSSYRLFNLLNAMTSCIRCKIAVRQVADLQELLKLIGNLQDPVIAIAHAAMKEEMPIYYSDQLYTALTFTKDGKVVFSSDTLQPRGGWKDLELLKRPQQMTIQPNTTNVAFYCKEDSTVRF